MYLPKRALTITTHSTLTPETTHPVTCLLIIVETHVWMRYLKTTKGRSSNFSSNALLSLLPLHAVLHIPPAQQRREYLLYLSLRNKTKVSAIKKTPTDAKYCPSIWNHWCYHRFEVYGTAPLEFLLWNSLVQATKSLHCISQTLF